MPMQDDAYAKPNEVMLSEGFDWSTASAMELALTARTVNAAEAKDLGLVSEVLADRSALYRRAYELAAFIAKKSPVATTGTKHVLLQARYPVHSADA